MPGKNPFDKAVLDLILFAIYSLWEDDSERLSGAHGMNPWLLDGTLELV